MENNAAELGSARGFAGLGEVRVVALGGMGEIGMNCTVLEQALEPAEGAPDGRVERLLIDCGVTFPSDDYGVDCLHPRFDHLLAEPAAIAGLVLTHGHEDHIGALPYLLRALRGNGGRDAPLDVYGPAYAVELVKKRLEEHRAVRDALRLHVVSPGQRFAVGGFEVEPIRVTHSMVDATALAVTTAAGTVVHSGDFKIDDAPGDGELTDVTRLSELGDAGVRLLLSDSTNALSAGSTGSEQLAADSLARIVAAADQRVVVGLFASNLHRLDAVARCAVAEGRRLCLLGRSMLTHAEIGQRLERVQWPNDLLVTPQHAAKLPRNQVIYAATGTQAEDRAALRRLSRGQHGEVDLEAGDRVVLSSRIIPGNERGVHAMVNEFLRRGVEVVSQLTERDVHVSGHAHRDEQRHLLSLLRPETFIPLHGTLIHLRRHAALARQAGVADTLVLLNGEMANVTATELSTVGQVPVGRVAISWGNEIGAEVVRDRRRIGRAGVVVVAVLRGVGGELDSVHATVRGLPGDLPLLCERVSRAAASRVDTRKDEALTEAIRRAVRLRVGEMVGERPEVEVMLLSPASDAGESADDEA
jgi:ribonuclease J